MSLDAAAPTSLEVYIRARLEQKKLLLMTHAVVGYPSFDANMTMLDHPIFINNHRFGRPNNP